MLKVTYSYLQKEIDALRLRIKARSEVGEALAAERAQLLTQRGAARDRLLAMQMVCE
jgi:hypothetical protein